LLSALAVALTALFVGSTANAEPDLKDILKKNPGILKKISPKTNNTMMEVQLLSGDFDKWGESKVFTSADELKYVKLRWRTKESGAAKGLWFLANDKPVKLGNIIKGEQVTPAPAPGKQQFFNVDVKKHIAAQNNGSVPNGVYYMIIYAQDAQNGFLGKQSNIIELKLTNPGPVTKFKVNLNR
jgi:hypothetical protein